MLILGIVPSAPDNPVIHEWFSPMNLQRLENSLTGFGAGDLWAVINYSCRDSCTVRFSSHPAVVDITESQPDTPSRVIIVAPETLGVVRGLSSETLFRLAALSQSEIFSQPYSMARKACRSPVLMTDCSYVMYPEMVVVQQCLLVTVSKVHLCLHFFLKCHSLLTERR